MRISFLALLVFALLLPVTATDLVEGAPPSFVEGMVTTEGKGVHGVEITIWDGQSNRKAVSNSEGKFSIGGLAPGTDFAVRFTPRNHRSVRADGFRFPEKGNLYLHLEYAVAPRGQRYTLRVPSNPSTGYEWFLLQQGDPGVAAFRSNIMETAEISVDTPEKSEWQPGNQGKWTSPQPSPPAPAGRGGWERWTFHTFSEGNSVIVLGYFRSWETSISPARYHVLSLIVQ